MIALQAWGLLGVGSLSVGHTWLVCISAIAILTNLALIEVGHLLLSGVLLQIWLLARGLNALRIVLSLVLLTVGDLIELLHQKSSVCPSFVRLLIGSRLSCSILSLASLILIELPNNVSQDVLLLRLLSLIALSNLLGWVCNLLSLLIIICHHLGLVTLSTLRLSIVHFLHELKLMDICAYIRLCGVKLLRLAAHDALPIHRFLSFRLLLRNDLVLLLQSSWLLIVRLDSLRLNLLVQLHVLADQVTLDVDLGLIQLLLDIHWLCLLSGVYHRSFVFLSACIHAFKETHLN